MRWMVVGALVIATGVAGVRQVEAQAATPTPAAQGQGRIAGRVVDAENGQPVPTAQVTIVGREGGYPTELDGRYKTGLIPAGRYSVIARRLGLQAKQYDGIGVTDGQSTVVTFALGTAAVALQTVQ